MKLPPMFIKIGKTLEKNFKAKKKGL